MLAMTFRDSASFRGAFCRTGHGHPIRTSPQGGVEEQTQRDIRGATAGLWNLGLRRGFLCFFVFVRLSGFAAAIRLGRFPSEELHQNF